MGYDFNPRPPRGGRRHGNDLKSLSRKISIHAPREGGDSTRSGDIYPNIYISIHAPREGGDPLVGLNFLFDIISIHAPREGGDLWNTL